MELKTYCCIRFTRKTGKIDTTLEGVGSGMLRMWALQNTTKTKDTIIFEKDTGIVCWYYEGNVSGFPTIDEEDLGHIDDYCPGMLKAIQQSE